MRRFILLSVFAVFFGSCLGCMRDLRDVPVYKGGTTISYKRSLFGNKMMIETMADSNLAMDSINLDPKTRSLDAKGVKIEQAASKTMAENFPLQQAQFVLGMQQQVEQSKIQMQTALGMAQEIRGAIVDAMNAAAPLMQLRNERAQIHGANSQNDLLPSLLNQYLPQLIGPGGPTGEGFNADVHNLKAGTFSSLLKAKAVQQKYQGDPDLDALVQELENCMAHCSTIKDLQQWTPGEEQTKDAMIRKLQQDLANEKAKHEGQ